MYISATYLQTCSRAFCNHISVHVRTQFADKIPDVFDDGENCYFTLSHLNFYNVIIILW